MKEQKIIFKNSRGQKIVGLLLDHGKDFVVVHCHGYGTTKESKTAESLMKEADRNQLSFFRFDFVGCGKSDGEIKEMTMSTALNDLVSVVNFLKNGGFKSFALSGSSFGGGVVLNFPVDNKEIKSVALKAPVSDYPNIPVAEMDDTEKDREFLQDAAKYTIYEKADRITCPVLILHGDKDECVPLSQSQKTCSIIPDCKLEIVKGGNHRLSDHNDLFTKEFVEFFKENK